MGGNYPGFELPRWELSWAGIFRVEIVGVGVILCGTFPRGEYSRWELFGGNHLNPPNSVNANKTNPSKVNPFTPVRPRKGDHFSKTPNQDDNENKKSNSVFDKNTNKDQSKNKKIYILGDSMIKNLKGWEMSKKLKNANVYVRLFAGAKVRCMKDHIKLTLREKTNHIVPHVGTNDLVSDRLPDLIAKSIVDVASSMKNENHDVTVSNIIPRADHFKEKANEVNDYLSKLCIERDKICIKFFN